MTRRPGRPVGTLKDDARRHTVRIRLTDAELARWHECADREVLTLSDLARAGVDLIYARGGSR